jgi:biopolymer transport protein TolR
MATILAHGGLRTRPDVTPFIDVLLVLIVIFMIQIRFVLQAQLAQHEAVAAPFGAPIVLELPDSGGLLLNHRPVVREYLSGVLRETFSDGRPSLLFVRSGPRRLYRETIDAIDAAYGAGVEVVSLAP